MIHVVQAIMRAEPTRLDQSVSDVLRYLKAYKIPDILKKRFLTSYMVHLKREKRYFEYNEIYDIVYFMEEDDDGMNSMIDEILFTPDFFF